MTCPTCGATLPVADARCPDCAAGLATGAPPTPAPTRPGAITLLALLHFASGVAHLLIAVVLCVAAFRAGGGWYLLASLAGGLAALHLLSGRGLWVLAGYGRVLQIAFACVGLILFPLGTLLSILILYYLFQPRQKLLFSAKPPDRWTAEESELFARTSDSGLVPALVIAAVVLVGYVAVVGIVAAIAIPNLLRAIDRGKQTRTMVDMEAIGNALDAFASDHGVYPVTDGLTELRSVLEPHYLDAVPTRDGWGHPLVVRSEVDGYIIHSPGKDGVLETKPTGGPRRRFEDDIIYGDGWFQQFPRRLEGRRGR